MLQLDDQTGLASAVAIFPDEQGVESVILVVKASYVLQDGEAVLAAEQLPVRLADEYHGEPGASSLKAAGEMHLPKQGCDIVLAGSAHALGGEPVRQMEVGLRVGSLDSRLLIVGDRRWEAGLFGAKASDPAPFTEMPLVWERAFGGVWHPQGEDGPVEAEERNPVGRGFPGSRKPKAMDGVALPNIEDPAAPIRSPKDRPVPVGWGAVAPNWLPRRQYAGTYDEAWQRHRAPFLPTDYDRRFANVAHPDLVIADGLQGGEVVEIDGCRAEGPLHVRVPRLDLQARVRDRGSESVLSLPLDTLRIEAGEGVLELVWRGLHRCRRLPMDVERIGIERVGDAAAQGRLSAT